MEADYLRAAIAEPVTILGQSLERFSIGHFRLLRYLGNAFVCEGKPELYDLLQGIFVCGQKASEAQESIFKGLELPNGLIGNLFGLKPRRVYFSDFVSAWKESAGAFDVELKIAEFDKYIRSESNWPNLYNTNNEGRMPGAPFVQRVLVVLESKLGYSHQDALNAPWGEAMHDYYCFWEIEDRAKIVNDSDIAHLKAVEELERKALEMQEGGASCSN